MNVVYLYKIKKALTLCGGVLREDDLGTAPNITNGNDDGITASD